MNNLYAPWRGEYVSKDTPNKNTKENNCVFCEYAKNNTTNKSYILKRFDDFFVVMNTYPYAVGHFMIIPNEHIGDISDLDSEIFAKMSLVAQKGVALLKDAINAHGVNIGINLGECAGAGIAEHLHIHLVPRWKNDTNFMPMIAKNRVYSKDFDEVYKTLLNKVDNYF